MINKKSVNINSGSNKFKLRVRYSPDVLPAKSVIGKIKNLLYIIKELVKWQTSRTKK